MSKLAGIRTYDMCLAFQGVRVKWLQGLLQKQTKCVTFQVTLKHRTRMKKTISLEILHLSKSTKSYFLLKIDEVISFILTY